MDECKPLNVGMCFFGKQRYIASIACLKRALYLVGRCRLPVSKSELKARLVSALETEM